MRWAGWRTDGDAWIEARRQEVAAGPGQGDRRNTAEQLLHYAGIAAERISRVRELPITHAHALAIGADGNRSIAHERDQPTVVRKLVRGRVVRDHGRIRSLADL